MQVSCHSLRIIKRIFSQLVFFSIVPYGMKLSLAGRPGSATPGLGPITKVPVVARNISWNIEKSWKILKNVEEFVEDQFDILDRFRLGKWWIYGPMFKAAGVLCGVIFLFWIDRCVLSIFSPHRFMASQLAQGSDQIRSSSYHPSAMSSDSESDKELVNITHRLGATRTPFITACCVELIFCALMTSWMSDNEHYTVFFRVHEAKIGGAWWGKSYMKWPCLNGINYGEETSISTSIPAILGYPSP